MTRFWLTIESFAGAMMCSILCAPIIIGVVAFPVALLVNAQFTEVSPWVLFVTGAGMCFAGIADSWLLWQVWRHVRNTWHPVAPRVALALPRLHVAFRLVCGVFWIGHFIACLGMPFLGRIRFDFSTFEDGFVSVGVALLWWTGFAYAGNIFLLLALYAFTLRDSIVEFLWRNRLAVDLVIAAVCALVSLVFGR